MYVRSLKRPELLNNRAIRTRAHDAPTFDMVIPRCEAFKGSVGNHGSDEWNKLPADTRSLDSYSKFKDLQKRDLLATLALIQ